MVQIATFVTNYESIMAAVKIVLVFKMLMERAGNRFFTNVVDFPVIGSLAV